MEKIFLNSVFRKGFISNIVVGNGKIVLRDTHKLEVQSNLVHNNTLLALYKGLVLVKYTVEHNNNIKYVTIQMTNSVIANWIIEGKAPDKYTDNFLKVMKLLDTIPVTYNIVLDSKNIAEKYACDKYISNLKLESIQDIQSNNSEDSEDTLLISTKDIKLTGLSDLIDRG